MNAAIVLCRRELLRFVRQPTRILGSLAQPLLFWLFMGSGFAGSFAVAGGDQGIAHEPPIASSPQRGPTCSLAPSRLRTPSAYE